MDGLVAKFRERYDAPAKDAIWQQHSATFRRFWSDQVLAKGTGVIPDEICDVVIRVLSKWKTGRGELLDHLPMSFDQATMKTIEQIDVLWVKKRSIVRAIEVEHTTSVYSGLLRMADLLAMQPNLRIKLHIVAPLSRRDKVLREIRRPVFMLLEGGALADTCTYLSYETIADIQGQEHLNRLSDKVLDDYEEKAQETD